MSCDITTLLDEAKCFSCLSPGFWDLAELQLLCNWSGQSAGPVRFISANIPLDSSQMYTVPHGLGRTPVFLRVVLKCTNNDVGTGAVVGQEIDAIDWSMIVFGGPFSGIGFPINVAADATNVYVYFSSAQNFPGYNANWFVAVPGATPSNPSDFTGNFKLKIYAST